jgi:hypothetical protein
MGLSPKTKIGMSLIEFTEVTKTAAERAKEPEYITPGDIELFMEEIRKHSQYYARKTKHYKKTRSRRNP